MNFNFLKETVIFKGVTMPFSSCYLKSRLVGGTQ